jgi:hypothetical protein
MGRCPLYGSCKIDAALLAEVGAEDKTSEKLKYLHVICSGKGNPRNQWQDCVNYLSHNPIKLAGKEQRNMIIGITIGVGIGLFGGIASGETVAIIAALIAGAFLGIGLSSISVTFCAIKDAIERFLKNFLHEQQAWNFSVGVTLLCSPYILLITPIVGAVRYFKRRALLKENQTDK